MTWAAQQMCILAGQSQPVSCTGSKVHIGRGCVHVCHVLIVIQDFRELLSAAETN